jgi:hypothetical protein
MSLTLNNNISSMKPGDYVWCKYTVPTSGSIGYFSDFITKLDSDVSSNLIPVASSATSDGYFKFIFVGYDNQDRMKLIADRNIQHSISWDTLNSSGIIDEINFNKLKLTYNKLSATEVYKSTGVLTTNLVDGIIPTNGENWMIDLRYGPYVDISILDIKHISKITVNWGSNSWGNCYPIKTMAFQGSNDGINFEDIILLSGDNGIGVSGNIATFPSFSNGTTLSVFCDCNYKIIRFKPLSSFNGTYGSIIEIGIYDSCPDLINQNTGSANIRLLIGGTSATDIDNEWDQIIVNSTLNNTIVAGDNNIWNWNGINSMTSTTKPTTNYKIIRGNTSVNYSAVISSGTSLTSATLGFRPVLLIQLQSIPIFSGGLLSSSIHNQDAILTGSISNADGSSNKIQYKISLNDNQIYPTSGYTDLVTPLLSINYTIPNSLLTNMNNKITIAMNNEINKINTQDFYVTLYNNIPNGILSLSNTTTHSDNIELTGNISDSDSDKISYRILINDIEKLPWSGFVNDPYIDYTILNKDLNIGNNIIKVEYKDNYQSIGLGSWTNAITKTNNTSIINVQYINGSIVGAITDPDSDLIQYKLLINNKQVYPLNDYTEFEQVANVNYQINRNDILINKSNIVTIVAQDNFGGYITQDISFIGNYVGLMFMDENQEFYSTDIGELLKYLDFGTITLGQITDPIKILVQNKYGFKIKDINLFASNTLPNVSIELSKEENPFIATDNLILEKEYAINEIDYFYIRLNTSISANSVNGEFKIYAKATPI